MTANRGAAQPPPGSPIPEPKERSITQTTVTTHFFGEITCLPATHDHYGKPYADRGTPGELIAGEIESELPHSLPYSDPEPGDYLQDVTDAAVVDAAPLVDIVRRAIAYRDAADGCTTEPFIDECEADTLARELARWAETSGIQLTPESGQGALPTPATEDARAVEGAGVPRECATCPTGQAEPPRRICAQCQDEIRRARPWVTWGWRAGIGLTMPVAVTAGTHKHCLAAMREYRGYGWLCALYPTGTQPEGLRLQVRQALAQS
ncbi:hypothetical protein [Streptomyces sp. NBC_00239]|uniref:hypothetical protein n=1 Tax=Streptomyces sp. NBC_00239 TaxID=2903640 RepID=UPI002E2E3434|nr:hypothetical protein [Streptomyces sp. NBC_00239]